MENERIYLSSPHMGGKEIQYIKEAFDTNWISPVGPHIDRFEKDIQDYAKVNHAVALSSGTAAIHLALIMLGVKQGDEVLCSSFTYIGSCNPIMYLKAIPIFIDSEWDSWNLDPDILEEAIKDRIKKGKRPKALILVHLYGMPAKLNKIMSIAHRYGVPVIEDAAEALGSSYEGKQLGTFGEIGIYSFNGNKIITTSGGGVLVSNKKKYIEGAKFLSTQARNPAPHYEHSEIGYNYRMSNICAAIGIGQLEVLDSHIACRRNIYIHYKKNLERLGYSFVEEKSYVFSNRWLTTALIDPEITGRNREDIRMHLEKVNIESRPLWKPMHLQPIFKNAIFYNASVCNKLFESGLCLPSGSNLSNDQLNSIITRLTL